MSTLRASSLLEAIQETLALSKTELGELFGVSRQAIDQWRDDGLPSSRQAKVAAVSAICDLLAHRLKGERIPGVARRPAAGYGGLNMLQMISRDRHEELLERIRASFDWSATA